MTPETLLPDQVFYIPGETHILGCAIDGIAQYSGKTLKELQTEYPGCQLMTWDDALEQLQKAAEAKYIEDPTEITADQFDKALSALPPKRWLRRGGSESFMLIEALWDDIRAIYCRIGDRYFNLCDRDTITHHEIVEKCRRAMAIAEITEEAYDHGLLEEETHTIGGLPDESFSVRYYARPPKSTKYYSRVGDRYFEFYALNTLTHEEIVARVREAYGDELGRFKG